jgi:hypothetical protein
MYGTRTTDLIAANPVRDEANQVKHGSQGDQRTNRSEANARHGDGPPPRGEGNYRVRGW